MFKITWLVMILRRLHITNITLCRWSLTRHHQRIPPHLLPQEKGRPVQLSTRAYGVISSHSNFFFRLDSFIHHTNEKHITGIKAPNGYESKNRGNKKKKMPKALWFHEFSKKLSPQVLKKPQPPWPCRWISHCRCTWSRPCFQGRRHGLWWMSRMA